MIRQIGVASALFVFVQCAACRAPAELEDRTTKPSLDRPAVVVLSVVPTGPGDLYGLRVGDLVHGWTRSPNGGDGPSEGPVESTLAVRRLEMDLAPLGGLVLRVRRQGSDVEVAMPSASWEVDFGPSDPAWSPEETTRIAELFRQEPSEEVLAAWTERTAVADSGDDPQGPSWKVGWLEQRVAAAAAALGRTEVAEEAFARAREEPGPAGDPVLEALALVEEGKLWRAASDPARADAAFRSAVSILRRETPGRPALALALLDWADGLPVRDRLEKIEEARAILIAAAPGGVDLARAFNHLGIYANDVAEELVEASAYYEQALALREEQIPGSYEVGLVRRNLADSLRLQGRLGEAESLLESALPFFADAPELQAQLGYTYNSLALLQRDLGKFRQARTNWEQALEIFRRLDPSGPAIAGLSNNLGNLSLRVGDFANARRRYEQALVLRRASAPESVAVAHSLNNLAIVAVEEGELDEARRLFEESLELKRRLAPDTLTFSNTLHGLGRVSLFQGRTEEADQFLGEALGIRMELAPRSMQTAEILTLQGRVAASSGRLDEGIESWRQGIGLLEETRNSFEFSAQERSIFASRFQDDYRDLVSVLAHLGRVEEAFDLFEVSRARALRLMTSPGGGPNDGTRELEHPASTWREVVRGLAPGTALIAFSVAEHETIVFVGSPHPAPAGTLDWKALDIDRSDLVRKVDLFRELVERGARGGEAQKIERALVHQAANLFDLLLGDLDETTVQARRWLIVPDRPLSTLPFAALVSDRDAVRFVGSQVPITYAVSATVFAWSAARGTGSGPPERLELFGRSKDFEDLGATFEGYADLPGVAAEARSVAAIFGPDALIFLDGDATEAAVKERLGSGRAAATRSSAPILHFATHARTEPRSPLDSALLLGAGDGEDGILTAREVIEEMRLRADLVTLSACDSGLGRDLGGEGVLGLSHAFLSVGARSVLTSLWSVSDQATADWMEIFYRNVRAGVALDEAVVAAQRGVLVRDDGSLRHPYSWAAFQLWGDGGGSRSAQD